jgi:hypothetical protein
VTAIAGAVIAVWGVAQVADVVVADYESPAEIHLAVMLVLGALFGLRGSDGDKPDEPPPPAAPPPPPPDEPVPLGRESAADLIARLLQERQDRG